MAISLCDVHTNKNQKEITAHGTEQFPLACYEDNMELMTVSPHWHDEFEFLVATGGNVTVQAATDTLVIPEGNAIFFNSGCLHAVKEVKNETSVLRSLVIHPKLLGGSSDSIFWQKIILPFTDHPDFQYLYLDLSEDWHKKAILLMMEAWNHVSLEEEDYENEARYKISKAFHLFADHISVLPSLNSQDSHMLARVKKLFAYIESHYAEDISNQDLMQAASCSESALLRSFRKIAGMPPMRYVLNYRIEKAASLLLTTSKKSSDIATECGFNDFSYFTKVFHREIGMTPIAYRASISDTDDGTGNYN